MPQHRILLTGASGYLGGSLLASWKSAGLPTYEKLFALVRNETQSNAVKSYGADPLTFDVSQKDAVEAALLDNRITIVLFLIDAIRSASQINFIEALGKVREAQGGEVHFVHTSGAKMFSSHAGAPIDRPLLDTEDLYRIQNNQKSHIDMVNRALKTNNTVIELCEARSVRAYIFIPCIVYGKGDGFGKTISIQTVAVVKAAKALKRMYNVNAGAAAHSWPVCHISDNTNLYLRLVSQVLADNSPPSGKKGYYLAASGTIHWEDLYSAFASVLAKRGLLIDDTVRAPTDEQIEHIAAALGTEASLVPLSIGGCCILTPHNGSNIGWSAHYKPQHILDIAEDEVDRILKQLP